MLQIVPRKVEKLPEVSLVHAAAVLWPAGDAGDRQQPDLVHADQGQSPRVTFQAPFPLQDRDLVVKVFDELDLIKGQAVLIRFSPGDGDELVEVDKKKFKRAFLVSSILFLVPTARLICRSGYQSKRSKPRW